MILVIGKRLLGFPNVTNRHANFIKGIFSNINIICFLKSNDFYSEIYLVLAQTIIFMKAYILSVTYVLS